MLCLFGEYLRGARIDGEGQFGLALSFIYRGMRCCVHHPARLKLPHHLANRIRVAKVELITRRREDLAERCERSRERFADLAAAPSDEDSTMRFLGRDQ